MRVVKLRVLPDSRIASRKFLFTEHDDAFKYLSRKLKQKVYLYKKIEVINLNIGGWVHGGDDGFHNSSGGEGGVWLPILAARSIAVVRYTCKQVLHLFSDIFLTTKEETLILDLNSRWRQMDARG
ncbi:hypothetical protein MSG28_002937 [Choristoneura fumiferana]|uniref:Uncharacterized protein n=1 Tax=Choristoneura fumiferana TaxID=7141 RepID=A0ACC0JJX6_CHOFU|nr:hypothetical protein MSG28_002937 [Choristoneura fumiferana]